MPRKISYRKSAETAAKLEVGIIKGQQAVESAKNKEQKEKRQAALESKIQKRKALMEKLSDADLR